MRWVTPWLKPVESRKDCEAGSEESSHDKNNMFNQDITTSQQETLNHQAEGFTMKNTIEKQEKGNKEMKEHSTNKEENSTLASQALPEKDAFDEEFDEAFRQALNTSCSIGYEITDSSNRENYLKTITPSMKKRKLEQLLRLLEDQEFIKLMFCLKEEQLRKLDSAIGLTLEYIDFRYWTEEDYQRALDAEAEYYAMMKKQEASNTDM